MGRSPCCDENGLKKGPWTPEEDQKLVHYIQKHGHGSWRALPKLAGLNRCGKSCRLRWTNYLRPDIKRGKFSQEEEQTILHLHSVLGNKWSAIASHLPGRTDNEIKNFWNTHLKKKLIQMGFDPMTHQPRTDIISTLPYLLALANLTATDLMDHPQTLDETAMKLQAEAVQLAKLQYLQSLLHPTNSFNTNNSYDQSSNITNMEAFNLLTSISNNFNENPLMSCSQLDNNASLFSNNGIGIGIVSSQPLPHHQNMISQISDPQVSFSASHQLCLNTEKINQQGANFTMINNEGEGIANDSSWIIPTSTPSSIPPNSNPGDASSCTSSHGGITSSFWPELIFEDPIIHDLS